MRLFRSGVTVSAMTSVSRIFGLVRDMVMAHSFSAGMEADAFSHFGVLLLGAVLVYLGALILTGVRNDLLNLHKQAQAEQRSSER